MRVIATLVIGHIESLGWKKPAFASDLLSEKQRSITNRRHFERIYRAQFSRGNRPRH